MRLLNELRESLQQQTATADVLKAISRSAFNLRSVLEELVRSACLLCGADFGHIRQREGEYFPVAASFGLMPEEHVLFMRPGRLTRGSVPGRAIDEGHIVHFPDVLDDPEFTSQGLAKAVGFRAAIGVPLISNGSVVGVLILNRRVPGPFSAKQLALVESFADQAVIAMENARLLDELRTRQRELESRSAELARSLEELRALSEVGRAVSSTLDLKVVLKTIVERAVVLSGTDAGSI